VNITALASGRRAAVARTAPSGDLPSVDVDGAAARSRDRHRRAAATSASAIAPKLLTLAILLIGARFVSATLPADGFGVWLLLITASGLLGFADLGMGNGLLNEVAAAHGRDDRDAMRRAISSATAALALVAVILVGAFLATAPFLSWSELLDVHGVSASAVTSAVGIFVAATAVSVGFAAAQRVRLGLQTGWVNNAWASAGGVMSLVAVVVAASLDASLPVLVAAAMFGQPLVAVADTVLLFGAQRTDLRPTRAAIRKDEALALLRQGSMFFFLAIAIAVGYESDALVISHALGADAVPQFALPYRIVMLAPAAVSLVMIALWPAYSEAMARGDSSWAERTMKRSLLVAGGGTLLTSLLVVVVGPYAWSWLGGSTAVPSRGLLLVLGLLACVMSVSTAFGVFLSATGRLRIQVVAAAAMAVSNVVLSLALVGPLGVAGPAWGTIISQTLCVLLPVGFVVGRSLRAAEREQTPRGWAAPSQPAMER
jgi:O-antigen/teichoic acid export membrane protein